VNYEQFQKEVRDLLKDKITDRVTQIKDHKEPFDWKLFPPPPKLSEDCKKLLRLLDVVNNPSKNVHDKLIEVQGLLPSDKGFKGNKDALSKVKAAIAADLKANKANLPPVVRTVAEQLALAKACDALEKHDIQSLRPVFGLPPKPSVTSFYTHKAQLQDLSPPKDQGEGLGLS